MHWVYVCLHTESRSSVADTFVIVQVHCVHVVCFDLVSVGQFHQISTPVITNQLNTLVTPHSISGIHVYMCFLYTGPSWSDWIWDGIIRGVSKLCDLFACLQALVQLGGPLAISRRIQFTSHLIDPSPFQLVEMTSLYKVHITALWWTCCYDALSHENSLGNLVTLSDVPWSQVLWVIESLSSMLKANKLFLESISHQSNMEKLCID